MAASGPTLPDARTMHPNDFALAMALHDLFTQLDTSLREYGATHNLHYSTVSNYLSCKKGLPPWDFIKTLAEDVAEAQGFEKPTRAMIVHLWELHKLAEKAREKKDTVEELHAELDKARKEAETHAQRERRINDQLLAAKTHIASLRSQVLALESGHVSPLPRRSTELALREVQAQLRNERTSAEKAIAELREQLDQERELKEKAEQDCRRCEELIREMLTPAGNPVGKTDGVPEAQDDPLPEMPSITSATGNASLRPGQPTPPYPAELTEFLRSRLDAKDAEIDTLNAEIDAKDTQIAELQDRVNMLLRQYGRVNQSYLEERGKAQYWERCCDELQKVSGDHAR